MYQTYGVASAEIRRRLVQLEEVKKRWEKMYEEDMLLLRAIETRGVSSFKSANYE